MNTHKKFNQAFHGCHVAGVTLLNIVNLNLVEGFSITTNVGTFNFANDDTWVEIAKEILSTKN